MQTPYKVRLDVTDLSLSRGNFALIAGLTFSVAPGDALWLTGPNGIGKTTLLMALAGLLRPDEGDIQWRYLTDEDKIDLSAPQALSYAAHRGPERAGLTLGEEMTFWQALYQDRLPLSERFGAVGLGGREDTPVEGLSAGQRRRLSLARLMASGRAAWLMDEPLAGLDQEGRELVTSVLGQHLSQGGLAIIASHQPVPITNVEARRLVLEPGT
jgi:heme exporter protein A